MSEQQHLPWWRNSGVISTIACAVMFTSGASFAVLILLGILEQSHLIKGEQWDMLYSIIRNNMSGYLTGAIVGGCTFGLPLGLVTSLNKREQALTAEQHFDQKNKR